MKNIITTVISKIQVHHILMIMVLGISAFAHGYNMLNYPYFENDEGTYMSHAWSVLSQGKLAPYTYWYDHAPAGWLFIALWSLLTGGFSTFGLAVDSGRVFMLVLHVISTFFLFDIARKLTKQPWAGVIACFIFSLSPLAVYFQRRVILDNIMIFWVLWSFWLLMREKLTLVRIYVSAVVFGIAVLTKENAIFFSPAFLFAVYRFSDKQHRSFAAVLWSMIAAMVISLYGLYAILNNEFFPVSNSLSEERVSLLTTLGNQLSRGKHYPFWDTRSDFSFVFSEWVRKDSALLYIGIGVSIIATVLSIRFTYFRFPALLGVLFWFFLLRGGLVIDFYIVPLIPILALNIGMLFDYIIYFISKGSYSTYVVLMAVISLCIGSWYTWQGLPLYTKNETLVQRQAFTWMKEHIDKNAVVAVDAYGLVDYWQAGFKNAIWFWKLWSDPYVLRSIGNTWERIDYVMLSHEMVRAFESKIKGSELLESAVRSSNQLASFGPVSDTYIDLHTNKSTNGDWVWPMEIQSKSPKVLADSWNTFSKSFITSDGQVNDFDLKQTTSEGQSYGMLRAVYMDDKEMFDKVWQWTRTNLQKRPKDKLFSWIYKDGRVTDLESATDADLDIALSLIFASKQWEVPAYETQAKELLADIWLYEIVQIQGRYILVANSNPYRSEIGYLVNPSYFSPAHYRIFAQVDKEHNWLQLAQDTYSVLNDISNATTYGPENKLPPNWIMVDEQGKLSSAAIVTNSTAGQFGYDAFRTYFRVALDSLWFHSEEGREYLAKAMPVFAPIWDRSRHIKGPYTVDGKQTVDYPDISIAAGPASVFAIVDPQRAQQMLTEVYYKSYVERNGLWLEPAKYYDQNWAWFATALLSGNLPNLFE